MRWLILITFIAGCLSKQGAPCTIDSDCKSGVCGLDGECRTSADPGTAFTETGTAPPAPKDTTRNTPRLKDGPTGKMCTSADWATNSSTQCTEPDAKYKITALALSTTADHAFQGFAETGNRVIKTSLDDGDIDIAGWTWSSDPAATDCDFSIAWVMGGEAKLCTAVSMTRFPLMMPKLARSDTGTIADIHDAVYDPASGTLSGHIIVDEFKSGLIETLTSVADGMTPDVDSNDDGENDALSVVVQLTLTLQSE